MTNTILPELPKKRLRVLMLTEGTYPFHWGGVSTWCHLLMRDLPNIDFELLSLAAEPGMESQFTLPGNVVAFHPIPLWGVRELLENQPDLGLADLRERKQRTTEAVVIHGLVPHFRLFLQELFINKRGPNAMAHAIHQMHRFFLVYDFDTAMRSQIIWETLITVVQESFPTVAANLGYPAARYQLADLTTAMQWLYHWCFPLGAPLPKTDVAHAAMVGICTMIAVASKLEHGAAYMLTEHGIYLRERYLAEAATAKSFFLKVFNLNFAKRMTELTYALADQISPCCDYNHRWELRNGAKPEQIRTIYYGVDSETFAPEAKTFGDPPVVVWVGRIDPLKDLMTLLRAAALVHRSRPDIEFRLYGSAPPGNEDYYATCLELRKELGLEETVIFGGYRADVASAFHEGDIVVLSSISEAFPFVILEAMLCEKPVVATGVGGVPEQLEGCGFALEPRNPTAMAEAILTLMGDPELCATLGQAARVKAVREFTVRQSGLAHEASYRRILKRHQLRTAQAETYLQLPRMSGLLQCVTKVRARAKYLAEQANKRVEVQINNGVIFHSNQPINLQAVANSSTARMTTIDQPQPNEEMQAIYSLHPLTVEQVRHRHGRGNGHTNGNGSNGHGHHSGYHHDHTTDQPHRHSSVTSARPIDDRWLITHAEAIARLATEVAQRDRQPIDALEITAIIESLGVTDEVAQQRYGADDAFVLGEAVFDYLKTTGAPAPPLEAVLEPHTTRWEMLRDFSRGFLALLPAVVLLLCIFAYSAAGQWSQNLVLALSAGMTSSMLITNGIIQALSRRTSIYLGLGKPAIAGRFLWQSTTLAFVGLVGFILLAGLVVNELGFFAVEERWIFALAFLSLSALWMAAGGLSLIQKTGWLGLGMVSGLLVGSTVDRLLLPFSTWHLAVGSVAGYGTAMSIIIIALRQGYTDPNRIKAKRAKSLPMPSRAYLLHEATPYFAYGFLYMAFILLPHILGWLGALGIDQVRSWAVTSVEIGLTASMPPLIIANGVAEHALRRFWRHAPALQAQTAGDNVAQFRTALVKFYWHYAKVYLAALTILSLGTHLLFPLVVDAGIIERWLHLPNAAQLIFIFNAGLIAYGLLGLGIFSCMFCITVGAPQLAMQAVGWGLMTTLLIGIPLSGMHYTFSALAFICGAIVFVIAAWKMCNRVLQSSDYRFAMAL